MFIPCAESFIAFEIGVAPTLGRCYAGKLILLIYVTEMGHLTLENYFSDQGPIYYLISQDGLHLTIQKAQYD